MINNNTVNKTGEEHEESNPPPLCLQAQFLFFGGHRKEKINSLLECITAYHSLYGDKLTWGFEPRTWKSMPLTDRKMPPVKNHFKHMANQNNAIWWYAASGDGYKKNSEFMISCLTNRDWDIQNASYVKFRVSAEEGLNPLKLKKIENLFLFFIERLQPFHAYLGFQASAPFTETDIESDIYHQATQFRGIYQDMNHREMGYIKNGIKSMGWLTFVSLTLTERVDGANNFFTRCKRFNVPCTLYANGFVLKASEIPKILPIDEPIPPIYLNINHMLRPLRNGKYGALGTESLHDGRYFNHEHSDLWIRRFDEPTLWPPQEERYVKKKPYEKTYVKSGEPCQIYGRYRYTEQKQLNGLPVYVENKNRDAFDLDAIDHRQHVVLMRDDIAPYFLELGQHGEFLGRESIKWELVAEL